MEVLLLKCSIFCLIASQKRQKSFWTHVEDIKNNLLHSRNTLLKNLHRATRRNIKLEAKWQKNSFKKMIFGHFTSNFSCFTCNFDMISMDLHRLPPCYRSLRLKNYMFYLKLEPQTQLTNSIWSEHVNSDEKNKTNPIDRS